MNLKLNIERIVLHGASGEVRADVAAAVEQELAQLFRDRGAPASFAPGQEHRIDSSSIHLGRDNRAARVGARVAQSIYSQIMTHSRSGDAK